MRKISIIGLALISIMASCGKRVSTTAKIENSLDTFSYAQGVMFASFLKSQGITDINFDALYRGLNEGLTKDSGYLMEMNSMNTLSQTFVKDAQKAKIEPLRKKSMEYTNGLEKKGYTKLPSGGYYKITKKGNGPNAKPSDTVEMNFTISNLEGAVLLNSIEMAQGQTTRLPLSMLQLPPLEDAMEVIPVGSEFELIMATDLYPFLSRFSKKFDDNYGVSICKFEIISVTPAK